MAVIKDSQFSDSGLHSIGNVFTDHMALYYVNGLSCLLSDVCHITERKRKGKGLEITCKYNYYYGFTKDQAFNQDPMFIVVIMLVPPATKQDQVFI